MSGAVDSVAAPALLVLPGGTFQMGAADEDDKFASVVEKPRHTVRVQRFAIGLTPVTFEQWDAYVADNPGAHRPADHGYGRGLLPVFNVSWNDTVGYVQWLAESTGQPFRLPGEAEWEYACRAGTDTVFNTGSRISIQQANYLYTDFRDRPGRRHPLPVASFSPNAFGLFDMHGNVSELVADHWHDTYAGAPTDGSPWLQPSHPWRVVRGGGWDAMPRLLRSAFRDWIPPNQRLDNLGFRVACDVAIK